MLLQKCVSTNGWLDLFQSAETHGHLLQNSCEGNWVFKAWPKVHTLAFPQTILPMVDAHFGWVCLGCGLLAILLPLQKAPNATSRGRVHSALDELGIPWPPGLFDAFIPTMSTGLTPSRQCQMSGIFGALPLLHLSLTLPFNLGEWCFCLFLRGRA